MDFDDEEKEKILSFFEKNPHLLDNLSEYFSQIELKANSRLKLSLDRQLGSDVPVEPPEYWEIVRKFAKLGKVQSTTLRDPQKFIKFLENAQKALSEIVPEEEKSILLKDFFDEEE